MKTSKTVTSVLFALNITSSVILAPSLSSSEILFGNALVQNYSDFQKYIDLHKKRVTELGLALYQLYLDRYHQVPYEYVHAFLKLHDQSKLREPNSKALYSFYGQNQNFVDSFTQKQMQKTIQKLNDYDHGIAQLFFQGVGVSPWQARLLLEIEKIADLVDRGMDPVAHEDFEGKGLYKMKLGSEYLTDDFSQKAAFELEKKYEVITGKYSFVQFCSKVFKNP